MTPEEIKKLRESFENSEIFEYYKKYGDKRAESYTNLSFRQKGGSPALKAATEAAKQKKTYLKGAKVSAQRRIDISVKEHQRVYNKLPERFTRENILEITTGAIVNALLFNYPGAIQAYGKTYNRFFVKLRYNLKDAGKNNQMVSKELIEELVKSFVPKGLSEEHRTKQSLALKGREKSEEHKANISKAKKNVSISEEHKKKISKTLTGRPLPKDHGVWKTWKCVHCGKEGQNPSSYHRWGHADGSCTKPRPVILKSATLKKCEILQEGLPPSFTMKQAYKFAKENKITRGMCFWWVTENSKVIHEGTNGSPYDVKVYHISKDIWDTLNNDKDKIEYIYNIQEYPEHKKPKKS